MKVGAVQIAVDFARFYFMTTADVDVFRSRWFAERVPQLREAQCVTIGGTPWRAHCGHLDSYYFL
jgi:hypothetical protein